MIVECDEEYQMINGFFLCEIISSALNSETNEHVALKKIANAFDNKIDAKRTLREIKLLRHMDHENVSSVLLFSCFPFLIPCHRYPSFLVI